MNSVNNFKPVVNRLLPPWYFYTPRENVLKKMSNLQQNIEEYYKEKIKNKKNPEDKPVTAGADVVFGLDGFAVTAGSLGFKIESLS